MQMARWTREYTPWIVAIVMGCGWVMLIGWLRTIRRNRTDADHIHRTQNPIQTETTTQ